MKQIRIDEEIKRCTEFIKDYSSKAGFSKLVIGLSGGIDSAVSAALAVQAVGADNVTGLILPYKTSHPDSASDALSLATQMGIKTLEINISPMVDAYFESYETNASPLRRGNFMARMRMSVLYDYSSKLPALVVGTGNRTEILVGYFTQHGDGACALEPIGHLYKTEVREMARALQLPSSIIEKAPTADLWEAQTDEAEMGITYPILDEILYQITELGVSPETSGELSHPAELYDKVQRMIDVSEFKRNLAPIPPRIY